MKNKRNKYYFFFGLLCVLLLAAADQLTKYLAVQYLKENTSISLIEGVLELKYLENRGIAFGMLQGAVVFFIIFYIIIFAAVVYFFIKLPKESYYIPLYATLLLMTGGGIGNFIDRVFRGYVVDFIYFSLIDFPIFNFADIYVVTGCILLVFLVCIKYKEEDLAVFHTKKKG